jgi:hypothetical protein
MDHPVKHVVDFYSIAALILTFAGWLPHIAALLTIVWTSIRIIETETVQRLIKKLRKKNDAP